MTSYMPGVNRCDRAGECFERTLTQSIVAQAPQVFAVSSDCPTISECMGTTEPTFTAHEGNPCDNNGVCNDMGVCIKRIEATQVTCGEQGGGDATCSPDSVSDDVASRLRHIFDPHVPAVLSAYGRYGSWYQMAVEMMASQAFVSRLSVDRHVFVSSERSSLLKSVTEEMSTLSLRATKP